MGNLPQPFDGCLHPGVNGLGVVEVCGPRAGGMEVPPLLLSLSLSLSLSFLSLLVALSALSSSERHTSDG